MTPTERELALIWIEDAAIHIENMGQYQCQCSGCEYGRSARVSGLRRAMQWIKNDGKDGEG